MQPQAALEMKTPEEFIEDFDDGAFEVPERMMDDEVIAECQFAQACQTPGECKAEGRCRKDGAGTVTVDLE